MSMVKTSIRTQRRPSLLTVGLPQLHCRGLQSCAARPEGGEERPAQRRGATCGAGAEHQVGWARQDDRMK